MRKAWASEAYGLLLKDIESSDLRNNVFTGNTVALYMEGATRNNFEANRVKKNGWAVRILGSADENTFRGNSFEDNVFDVATNSRDTLNTFEGNYGLGHLYTIWIRMVLGMCHTDRLQSLRYGVNQYSVLIMLLSAPVIEFLEVAERVMPVITPVDLKDPAPLLRPPV